MSPEELYSIFHIETNACAGRQVRRVKNFDKAKAKDTWKYFESLSAFMYRNNGHVNPELYIRAMAQHYEGWFNPNLFGKPKSIGIYKTYINELHKNTDPAQIKKQIIDSIGFVVRYCCAKDLKNIYEYFDEDKYMIPTMLKHLHAGSISLYFLTCIDSIRTILRNYPQDCIDDYASNFDSDYKLARIRLLGAEELDELRENVERVVNQLIEKEKSK